MSRENLNNEHVKIEVSQEDLEESISGLSQLLPILEVLVRKGSGDNEEDVRKLNKHFETAIDAMTMILLILEKYQETVPEENLTGWKQDVMRTFLGGRR